ncbi:MAG: glucosamine--fructose-6-phosphate aminotransferase [Verrucomicrobia bacterium]|nr:glucosamine--fructose-6-phosphate aminotransferase [Verrucomicrobiota bacterium]
MAVEDCQPGRVVPPIFQPPQGIEENRLGIPRADIGNNSAHRELVLHFCVDRVNE